MGGAVAIVASNAIIETSTVSQCSARFGSGLALLRSNVTVLDGKLIENRDVEDNVSTDLLLSELPFLHSAWIGKWQQFER